MLNRITLMGRITRELELKHTPSNVPVIGFALAVERDYAAQGEKREADFIDIVAWRQTAEFISRYFKKGQLMAVDGRLQCRKWKDKFDQNRVAVEVVADSVYFAEGKREPAEPSPEAPAQKPPPKAEAASAKPEHKEEPADGGSFKFSDAMKEYHDGYRELTGEEPDDVPF